MKQGAIFGAIFAFFVYMLLPIHNTDGTPANIIPTGDVVSETTGFVTYVNNLPFSMLTFFALEILGISVGAASQVVLKKYYIK